MVKTNENPNGAPTSHNASEVEVINFNKEVKDESKLVATIEDEVIEIADDNTNTPDEYETASIEKKNLRQQTTIINANITIKENKIVAKARDEIINDLLGYEGLKIIQRPDIFNFSLDSTILADFVTIKMKDKKIIDLGCGNGYIPIF